MKFKTELLMMMIVKPEHDAILFTLLKTDACLMTHKRVQIEIKIINDRSLFSQLSNQLQ